MIWSVWMGSECCSILILFRPSSSLYENEPYTIHIHLTHCSRDTVKRDESLVYCKVSCAGLYIVTYTVLSVQYSIWQQDICMYNTGLFCFCPNRARRVFFGDSGYFWESQAIFGRFRLFLGDSGYYWACVLWSRCGDIQPPDSHARSWLLSGSM